MDCQPPPDIALAKHRYPNKFTVNLSSHELTAGQTLLLSRGLSFCPTPGQPELSSTQEDLDGFHRSLRLKHFFSELEDDNSKTSHSNSQRVPSFFVSGRDEGFDNHKFHNKSRFNPKGPTALEALTPTMTPTITVSLTINVPRTTLVMQNG